MNSKRIISCITLAVFLLLNMCFIFYNSSLERASSSKISIGIATLIYNQANKQEESVANKGDAAQDSASSEADGKKTETPEQRLEREKKEQQEKEKQELRRNAQISKVNNRLRDVLHMVEFASMGFLSILLLMVITMCRMRFNMVISMIFCILYAISDEIHQIFVNGRSFELVDILLDSTGVSVGILIGGALFVLCKSYFVSRN